MGRLIELEGTSGEAHDPFEWPLPSLGPWASLQSGTYPAALPTLSVSFCPAMVPSPHTLSRCSSLIEASLCTLQYLACRHCGYSLCY